MRIYETWNKVFEERGDAIAASDALVAAAQG